MSFTIRPENDEAGSLLGKLASDLQTGVTLTQTGFTGTLKKVTDYTGFSGNTAEQSGHYLAIRVDTADDDDVITVELLGGTLGHPVTLDSDRNIVLRIANPRTQKVKVVATHTNEDTTTSTATNTYSLAGLRLA